MNEPSLKKPEELLAADPGVLEDAGEERSLEIARVVGYRDQLRIVQMGEDQVAAASSSRTTSS
jgi:hypothetical protein